MKKYKKERSIHKKRLVQQKAGKEFNSIEMSVLKLNNTFPVTSNTVFTDAIFANND